MGDYNLSAEEANLAKVWCHDYSKLSHILFTIVLCTKVINFCTT